MKIYFRVVCCILSVASIVCIILSMFNKKINYSKDGSIDFFLSGNDSNIGCLAVALPEYSDATYSFDGGLTWQYSNYGAIYENGNVELLVKDINNQIIFQKTIIVNNIISDAPIIKVDFDKKISSLKSSKLLKGVEALYNNKNINSELEVNVIEQNENSALVSYLADKNGKKCFILREIYVDKNIKDDEWLWPTNKPYSISSNYGWRNGVMHTGVDIYGTGRGSPIYAARDGKVVSISSSGSMGYYVTIKHDDGYYTQYLHMQNIYGNDNLGSSGSATKYIKVGQMVNAHDVIGEMGSSGDSTGVHLHFEIWGGIPYQSQSYDPLTFYK